MAQDPAAATDTRALGLVSLLALGINGIVGVGIFFTPTEVAGLVPGMAGVGVYAATALALAPIAIIYATLGGHFDQDGGPYVWARAAFGPTPAYLVGWIAYASALFSAATVVAGIAKFGGPSLGFVSLNEQRLFAALVVVGLASIASTGLKPSAIAWTAVTVLKLVPLVLLAGLGIALSSAVTPPSMAAAFTVEDFGRAVLIAVFATQGFEVVPLPAGNARGSSRSVPVATVGSLGLAVSLYVVLHAVCVRALPELSKSDAPLVDAARVYGGDWAAGLVAVGTNVSALGIAFGMFAMSPRYLFALNGADALGDWVGVEDKRRVPQRALWLTATLALGISVSGKLTELFVLSSLAVLAQFVMSTAALVALAWRREHGLRRSHLWPTPLALIAIGGVAISAQAIEAAIWGGVLMLGVVLIYARRLKTR